MADIKTPEEWYGIVAELIDSNSEQFPLTKHPFPHIPVMKHKMIGKNVENLSVRPDSPYIDPWILLFGISYSDISNKKIAEVYNYLIQHNPKPLVLENFYFCRFLQQLRFAKTHLDFCCDRYIHLFGRGCAECGSYINDVWCSAFKRRASRALHIQKETTETEGLIWKINWQEKPRALAYQDYPVFI